MITRGSVRFGGEMGLVLAFLNREDLLNEDSKLEENKLDEIIKEMEE